MRPVVISVLATALVLALQPAFAQSPSAATMPPGAQNPALIQPQMTPPVAPQPGAAQPLVIPPAAPQSGPQPNLSSPSALITPDSTGAGGLCECLINHDPRPAALDKTKMHQSCLGSVEACQSACETDHYYSFVPHATYTCPGPSGPATGHIAMNARLALLLSSRR